MCKLCKNAINTGVFDEFLETITERNKTKRKRLQEFTGYILSNYQTVKGALFFIGVPNSGKSTYLNLLTRIIGSDFVSSLLLNQFSSRFGVSALVDKKVNICGEIENLPSIGFEVECN